MGFHYILNPPCMTNHRKFGLVSQKFTFILVPCFRLNLTTDKLYCVVGCEWFID